MEAGQFVVAIGLASLAVLVLMTVLYAAIEYRRYRAPSIELTLQILLFGLSQLILAVVGSVVFSAVAFPARVTLGRIYAWITGDVIEQPLVLQLGLATTGVLVTQLVHLTHTLGLGRDIYWQRLDSTQPESAGADPLARRRTWPLRGLLRNLDGLVRSAIEATVGRSLELSPRHVRLGVRIRNALGDRGAQLLAKDYQRVALRTIPAGSLPALTDGLERALTENLNDAAAAINQVMNTIVGFGGTQFLSDASVDRFIARHK